MGDLSIGYELGHICGKFYSSDDFPLDDCLKNDLHNLLGVYRELKGHMQNPKDVEETINYIDTIIATEEQVEDSTFQEKMNKVLPVILEELPQQRQSPMEKNSKNVWPRSPSIARGTLEKALYLCENDLSHKTFISKVTGENYTEAHHLVPMKLQGEFDNSIDVTGNILCLCPNCHSTFHHATKEEQKSIITKFYKRRKDTLTRYNIEISLELLIKNY